MTREKFNIKMKGFKSTVSKFVAADHILAQKEVLTQNPARIGTGGRQER